MTRCIAGIILIRDDGAVLMQHRDDKPGLTHAGLWVMPGGHCDSGETMEMCARRELREETDYDCDDLRWLCSFEDTEDSGCIFTMYWGRYDGRQPVQCREGQALKFLTRAQAASYPIPSFLLNFWDMALEASAKSAQPANKS